VTTAVKKCTCRVHQGCQETLALEVNQEKEYDNLLVNIVLIDQLLHRVHKAQLDQQDTLGSLEPRCAMYYMIKTTYLICNRELLELREDKDRKVSRVVVVIQDFLETLEHKEIEYAIRF